MKQFRWIAIALFIALIAGCGEKSVVPRLSRRSACSSNLHQLDIALVSYCYPSQTSYPANLSSLPPEDVEPRTFVCPSSGNEPGSLTNVHDWTDYIYVTGRGPGTTGDVPVLICPPIHHNGKAGIVLFATHAVSWVAKPDLDRLIDSLMEPSNQCTVVVSKRLTEKSGGRYRSRTANQAVQGP